MVTLFDNAREFQREPQYVHQGIEMNLPSFPSSDDNPVHSLKGHFKQQNEKAKILANTIKLNRIQPFFE